jgi:hypothetical protein
MLIGIEKLTNTMKMSRDVREMMVIMLFPFALLLQISFSLDGVLGGAFAYLTPVDVRDSNSFLDKLQAVYPAIRFDHVVDCGAGIGRITKNLLLPRSTTITLVDQNPRMLNASPSYIGSIPNGKTVSFIQQSFQVSFMFTASFFSDFVSLGFRSFGEVHRHDLAATRDWLFN